MRFGQEIRVGSHPYRTGAIIGLSIFVLLVICFIGGGSGLVGSSFAASRNPPPVAGSPAETSSQPTKPVWQTKLDVLETDFIEFISKDRVLVGTLDDVSYMSAFKAHEIMLLNSDTGQTIWSIPRGSFGLPQSLVSFAPVILIEGSKQFVALNPENGAQLWSRERAGSQSLLISARDLVIFLNRKPLSLSAMNVKTGNEVWKTPAENYPEDKNRVPALKNVGDVVLVAGPETIAFSVSDGKLLWRMPFPGTDRANAVAVPLGDDLYLTDSSVVTRSDPASGKEIWRTTISPGSAEAITASARDAFVLVKGSGDDPPDSIVALDRATGKQLWKYDLLDRAASPISILGNQLYVTTPGSVIALDALTGSVVFKTEIPERLQSRKQLPDNLRITNERIIVAREDGVLAVRRADGGLLFADEVVGGKGSTYDYLTHRNSQPVQSEDNYRPKADANYRVALVQQQSAFEQMRAFNQIQMTNQMNMVKQATSYQVPGSGQPAQYFAPRAAMVGYAAVGGIYAGAAVWSGIEAARQSEDAQIRLQQTFQTHGNSLQEKFYVRPTYEAGRGYSLHVVNLETGSHADILLSSDEPDLKKHHMDTKLTVANLPAFSAEGSRIVSKGLGENPEFLDKHRGIGLKLVFAFPSVLAFDAASLNFEAARPLAPVTKNSLDEQLVAAASKGDGEAVKKLVEAGANVNARDQYGRTALMLAAQAGAKSYKTDVIKLLLDRGADVKLRDAGGWTAFEYAMPVANTMKGAPAQKLIEKAQTEHK